MPRLGLKANLVTIASGPGIGFAAVTPLACLGSEGPRDTAAHRTGHPRVSTDPWVEGRCVAAIPAARGILGTFHYFERDERR